MTGSAIPEAVSETGVSITSVSELISCWRREDGLEKCRAFFPVLPIRALACTDRHQLYGSFLNVDVVGRKRMRYNQ